MARKMCFASGRSVRAGFILLAAIAAGSVARAEPAVTSVRIGTYPDKTRFVVDMTEAVKFSVFSLADPYRVVIDLPEVEWRIDARKPVKSRLITGFRYGLFRPGNARVVLDIAQPVAVARRFELPPGHGRGHRLVLDLVPTTRAVFMKSVGPPPGGRIARAPEIPAAPPHKPPPARDGRHIIAIDPGHGGVDPGTIGISGSKEKDITLAMAREVSRQLLAAHNYRVIMTRNRDVFVPLRGRIAIAQHAGAELFVSLHADSIANHSIRGGTVYTLSETASDAEAAALAAKENKADLIAGLDLSDQSPAVAKILIDLRQRLTKNASVVFARDVVDQLRRTTRLLPHNHRFAGFAVLKAPEIPSILIELGYLSNVTDERLLRQPRHRQQVAAALVRAINAFFSQKEARNRP
jgi:N-acetylmuramoyl-L-alanine amidase